MCNECVDPVLTGLAADGGVEPNCGKGRSITCPAFYLTEGL